MKRTFFSKALALVMALALAISIAAITASAAPITEYQDVNGSDTVPATATAFQKYLIVDNADVVIPTINTRYTIAAPTSIDATTSPSGLKLLPGVGAPTIEDVPFATGTAVAAVDSASIPDAIKTANAGKYYAAANIVVDFSNVTFDKPGVYRYEIKETNLGQGGVTYDDDTTRYLDVYVVNKEGTTDALEIASYVMHKEAAPVTDGEDDADTKSAYFVNKYSAKDLSVSKAVTGNQADKTKYFPFQIDLGAVPAGNYVVEYTGDDAQIVKDIASDITTSADKHIISITTSKSLTVYLKDGQTFTIKGVPSGSTYTARETDPDNYTAAAAYTSGSTTQAASDSTVNGKSGTMNATDNVAITVTNTLNGTVPTGVIMTIAPFAIGLLLFGSVAFFLISKRRREEY